MGHLDFDLTHMQAILYALQHTRNYHSKCLQDNRLDGVMRRFHEENRDILNETLNYIEEND